MDTQALQARLAELYPNVETLSHAQVQEAFATLSAETVPALKSHYIDSRGLYSLFGPVDGETVIGGMEAVAASDSPLAPIMKRALKWLDRPDLEGRQGGVNLGDPATRAMIDALTGSAFTPQQAATLKALGETQAPRWPGLALAALEALYQPAWEAAYWAEQAAIQAAADQLRAENPGMSEREARDLASYRLHNPGWNDPPVDVEPTAEGAS